MREMLQQVRAYHAKSKFLSPHARPLNRLRVQWHFLRRSSYAQWPLYGHVLPALADGRFEIGANVTLMAGCWLSMPGDARLRIGRGVYVNGNVMLHAYEHIEIGEFTAISRGSLITDGIHRADDPTRAFIPQGMAVKGPVVIGRNVWIGNNAAVLGGVEIGEGCFVGTNSVVTKSLPPFSVAVGAPARVIGTRPEGELHQRGAGPS